MLQDAGSKSSLQLLGLAFRTCLEYQVYTVIGLHISFQSRRRINQRKPRLVNELIEVPRQKAATEVSIGLEGSLAHFPCGRRLGLWVFHGIRQPNLNVLRVQPSSPLHFLRSFATLRICIQSLNEEKVDQLDLHHRLHMVGHISLEMTLQNDVFFFKWEEEGGHEAAKNLLAFPVNSMASWIIG